MSKLKIECRGIGWPRGILIVPSLSSICSFVKSRVPNDPRSIVVGLGLNEQPVVELSTAGLLRFVLATSLMLVQCIIPRCDTKVRFVWLLFDLLRQHQFVIVSRSQAMR